MSDLKKLFEYAVVFTPTAKELGKGEKQKIILNPTTILAANEQAAAMQVAREIPDDYADKLDQLDINIRPF